MAKIIDKNYRYYEAFAYFLKRNIKVHIFFAIISLFFGFMFIHSIPPLFGVDEVTHFARIYEIDQGYLREKKLPGNDYGGYLPVRIIRINQLVFDKLNSVLQKEKANQNTKGVIGSPKDYSSYTRLRIDASQTKLWDFTGSSIYNPLSYAGPLAGMKIARTFHMDIGGVIFLSRAGGLILYVLLMSVALWLLRDNTAKWLIFVFALLPMNIFQASIVNVDSIVLAESVLILALYIKLFSEKIYKIKYLIALSILIVLLSIAKSNYSVLALPLLFLPNNAWKNNSKRTIAYKLITVIVAIIFVGLWYLDTYQASSAISMYRGDVHNQINVTEQAKHIVTHPMSYLLVTARTFIFFGNYLTKGIFGLFGWSFIEASIVTVILSSILIFVASLYGLKVPPRLNKKFGSLLVLTGLLCAGGITTILYLTYNVVGASYIYGLQGRYFLPLIPFILYGVKLIVNVRIIEAKTVLLRVFFVLGSIAALTSAYITYAGAI